MYKIVSTLTGQLKQHVLFTANCAIMSQRTLGWMRTKELTSAKSVINSARMISLPLFRKQRASKHSVLIFRSLIA